MSFWKVFFGSLLAFIIGFFVVIFLSVLLIAGIASTFTKEEPVTVKANSVPSLDLDYDIPEQTTYRPNFGFSFADFSASVDPGLYEIGRAHV